MLVMMNAGVFFPGVYLFVQFFKMFCFIHIIDPWLSGPHILQVTILYITF